MAKPERKPMTFSVAAPSPIPAPPSAPEQATLPSVTKAAATKADATERQQVGARVTKATYRQLKSRAALSGETVQTLVEQAITEFLNKPSN
jgi:hypothetical protein